MQGKTIAGIIVGVGALLIGGKKIMNSMATAKATAEIKAKIKGPDPKAGSAPFTG